MKKSVVGVLFLYACIHGDIYEIDTIASVIKYAIKPGTLVLFDLQDTLLSSVYTHMDFSEKEKINKLLLPFVPSKNHLKWMFSKQVEKESTAVIEQIKNNGMLVGLLTKNSNLERAHPFYQLAYAHIDLSEELRRLPQLQLQGSQSLIIVDHGVISCGKNGKGEALALFLQATGIKPTAIIFVDDKIKFLVDVEKVVNELFNIPFIGLHYKVVKV